MSTSASPALPSPGPASPSSVWNVLMFPVPLPFKFTIVWNSVFLVAWFILNIIIFSLPETFLPNGNDAAAPSALTTSSLLPVELFTVQSFTTQVIIFLATHVATGFALKDLTRGSRYTAVIFSSMGTLAWLLNGSAYYSSYYSTNDPNVNQFCNAYVAARYCNAARTVTSLSVAVELGQVLNMLYVIALFLHPIYRKLQDASDRKLNRPQREYCFVWYPAESVDLNNQYILEQEEKALNNTKDVELANLAWKVSMLSRRIFVLSLLSLFGYAIFTLSFIVLTADITYINDPVYLMTARAFTLILSVSIAASGYSAFHHKRALVAGALCLSIFTTFTFWSFFISIARRITQLQTSPATVEGETEPSLTDIDASRGMVIGIGIITVTQTLLVWALRTRYHTFVPTKASPRQIELSQSHPFPPFNADGTHRFNSDLQLNHHEKFIHVFLFLQIFFGVVWMIVEIVGQSTGGLFDNVSAAPIVPYLLFSIYTITTETAFIFIVSNIFVVSSYCSIYYAVRRQHQGAWLGAFRVNVVCLCGWWLLIWPIAFHSSYSNGVVATLFCSFADQFDSVSNVWCDQAKANGVLAIIQGLLSFVLTCYTLKHYYGAAKQQDNKFIAVTTSQSRTFHVVSLIGQFGLVIWSLSAIREGYRTTTWNDFHLSNAATSMSSSFTFGYTILNILNGDIDAALPDAQLIIPATPSIFNVITYATAFGVVVLYGFATWVNSLAAESPFGHASKGIRLASAIMSLFVFFFLFPTFIEVCRWINTNPLVTPQGAPPTYQPSLAGSLTNSQYGIAAGIIIMTWGVALDFLVSVWLVKKHERDETLELTVLDDKAHLYRNDSNYGVEDEETQKLQN